MRAPPRTQGSTLRADGHRSLNTRRGKSAGAPTAVAAVLTLVLQCRAAANYD